MKDNLVIKFSKSKKNKRYLDNGIEVYNYSKNKLFNPDIYKKRKKIVGYYIYDSNKLIGGIYGYIDYENWLYIELLYIDEKYRNKKLGSRLIGLVKDYAKENNITGILLETWNFQAKDFYEKQGFEVYGKLDNHPVGTITYFMKMDLQ